MYQPVRGMKDFLPEEAAKKQFVEEICRKVFESYGFQPLETPAVEDFALLSKKGASGEEISNEIYYFKDKSERELGLRFDLTVPLARVVAGNPALQKPFKRYQIGNVYRYDRPGASRYREFTQADVDIVGCKSVLAEFECIAVAVEIMKKLGLDFYIKINGRKLLEEIALKCNVEKAQIKECFRSIDKLDKIGWSGVEAELKQKKIPLKILDVIKKNDLGEIGKLIGNGIEKNESLNELNELMNLLKKQNLNKFVKIDLSLARGLEYYTGIVFEVIAKNAKSSVGAGGRYDNLIELYGGSAAPAVGISFGIERLLDVLGEKFKAESKTKIFLAAIAVDEGKALEVAEKIRALGINCGMDLLRRNISKNLEYASRQKIPFVAILGSDELKKKEITLRNMKTGKQTKVKISNLGKLKNILKQLK